MSSTEQEWAALGAVDGAPTHQVELVTAHEGQPSVQVQDRTHGALFIGGGLPAVDKGMTEQQKYGGT